MQQWRDANVQEIAKIHKPNKTFSGVAAPGILISGIDIQGFSGLCSTRISGPVNSCMNELQKK